MMDKIYSESVALDIYDSTNIRVIEVMVNDPAAVVDVIHCQLRVVSLREKPIYTALSYTWGPPNPEYCIMITGKLFMVRRNLWEFLHQARQHGGKQPHWLWIDAVCIDQLNTMEKNHQVSMMGDIYSQAAKVLVWLGPATSDISFVLDNVSDHGAGFRWKDDFLHPQLVRGVKDLKNLEYWRRLWVLQEYLLAKELEIWCGTHRVTEPKLRWLLSRYLIGMLDDPASRLLRCRHGRRFTTSFTLPYLISEFGPYMKCQNVLDGIYGFLSLLDEDERRFLDIKPDYSKTALGLFHNLISKFYHMKRCNRWGQVHLQQFIADLTLVLKLNARMTSIYLHGVSDQDVL
jgi:hypothetical protein